MSYYSYNIPHSASCNVRPCAHVHTHAHTCFHMSPVIIIRKTSTGLAESVHTELIEKQKDTSEMKVNLTLPRCSVDKHAQYG